MDLEAPGFYGFTIDSLLVPHSPDSVQSQGSTHVRLAVQPTWLPHHDRATSIEEIEFEVSPEAPGIWKIFADPRSTMNVPR